MGASLTKLKTLKNSPSSGISGFGMSGIQEDEVTGLPTRLT